jgi:uncharacterized protein YbaR (Trm112 family)
VFVELLEKLRCPNPHEPSPLVATAALTVDRHIIEGRLGCPVCHAEFRIHEGALELGGEAPAPPAPQVAGGAAAHETMLRVGALLGLDERGGVFVLDLVGSHFIRELAELAPTAQFVALATTAGVAGANAVFLGCGDVIPLTNGCARGIALDRATPALLRSAVQLLAPGGRLIAPAHTAVPDGVTVLARDAEQWVGEREEAPVLSAIRRAPR